MRRIARTIVVELVVERVMQDYSERQNRCSNGLKFTCAVFFLTHSLIDRCQIVTDTCKNNVSNFVWKPFKSPLFTQMKKFQNNISP